MAINNGLQNYTFLTLPGWQDSEEDHWQTRFEKSLGGIRVEQTNWMEPKKDDWLQNVDAAVATLPKPGIFIAHSLGCLLVAHWATWANRTSGLEKIVGAFLVAPPDIERADMPAEILDFRPEPKVSLPFPSVLVGSDTDPYASPEKLVELSKTWGSCWIPSRAQGHINPEMGHGPWPEGWEYLVAFVAGLSY